MTNKGEFLTVDEAADTRGIVTDAGCPMAAASIQDRERNAMWRTPCRIPPSMASHFSMGE